MVKKMTCVACPLGCPIEVELSQTGEVLSVTGNTCKRGSAYAHTEIKSPVRSLTTTVKLRGGHRPVVPVKSSAPIPKKLLFEAMKVINVVTLKAPVNIGDIAVENILGTGVNIIVTNSDSGK